MIHNTHRYLVPFPSIFAQSHHRLLLLKCTTAPYLHIWATDPCLRATPSRGHLAWRFPIARPCSIVLRGIHDYQRIEDFDTASSSSSPGGLQQLIFYHSVRIRYNEVVVLLRCLGCLEHSATTTASGSLTTGWRGGWYQGGLDHEGDVIWNGFLFAWRRWALKGGWGRDGKMGNGIECTFLKGLWGGV